VNSPPSRSRLSSALPTFYGEEELHADLVPYVADCGDLGPCIRHPLVYSMMHHPKMNKLVNRSYKAKLAAVAANVARHNWRGVIWLHERPYRLAVFLDKADMFTDHHYWDMLGELWVDCENIYQTATTWRDAWTCDRPRRWAIMEKAERDRLKDMKKAGDPVTIYRGFSFPGGEIGMSWTLSEDKARWFSQRLLGLDPEIQRPRVATALVWPREILALFDGRGENEIVVLPESVFDERIKRSWPL
jgi:hypothetical protein